MKPVQKKAEKFMAILMVMEGVKLSYQALEYLFGANCLLSKY